MPDARPADAPGDQGHVPGVWTFLAADCVGFAIFFAVFMSERLKAPALFNWSARQLDIGLGLANTLILVTSGWLVALAMTLAGQGRVRRARQCLIGGLAIGSGFAVIKVFEYHAKLAAGITPATNGFFTFYFILTGVHLLHYAIGMIVLVAMAAALRTAEQPPAWLESGALYWHVVDVLWLFLFPLLYLLPGH